MPQATDQPAKPHRTWLPMVLWTAGIGAYLAGYMVCRCTGILVHTASVLNMDFHGREHMIVAGRRDSAFGRGVEIAFYPLREVELLARGMGCPRRP